MDLAVYRELERRFSTDESHFEKLVDIMDKTYKNTRSWALVPMDSGNAALFMSGLGDGFYSSYWGLGSDGAPLLLVTDFGLIDWH